jgi:hypothetical protein
LHFVQDPILEVIGQVRLEQLEAVAMDRPDVHLGHARDLAKDLFDSAGDSVLELGPCSVRKGEGNYVARAQPRLALLLQKLGHPLCEDLGLPGSSTGDDLQVLIERLDGQKLILRVWEKCGPRQFSSPCSVPACSGSYSSSTSGGKPEKLPEARSVDLGLSEMLENLLAREVRQ